MENYSINKVLNLFILISLLLLNKKNLIESYSQVSRVGVIVSSNTSVSNNNNDGNNNNISNSKNNSETIIKHNPGREGVFSSDNDKNNKTLLKLNDDVVGEINSIENKSSEVFTGRSAPSSPSSSLGGFQFPLNFNAKPISYRRPSMAKSNYNPNEKSSRLSSTSPMFVYPSYGSKSIDQTYKYSSNLPPTSTAMDRFSPGEAYGFQQYQKNKNKNSNGYNYTPPKSSMADKPVSPPATPPKQALPSVNRPVTAPILPTPPPSPVYVPPKDLYTFPPNIGSNYSPPNIKGNQLSVTSYLPPAAGNPDSYDSNSFIGPVNPKYLPSSNQQNKPSSMTTPDVMPNMSQQDMTPAMMISNGPVSPGSMTMDSPPNDKPNHDHNYDDDHPPPSGPDGPSSDELLDYHDHHHPNHDYDHDHSHDTPPPPPAPTTENPLTQMMAMVIDALKTNKQNNSPPPPPAPPSPPTSSGITFSSPDHDHSNYHDHSHDFTYHDHDFHGSHGIDALPEVVYDYNPHDHHHDIVTTTTPPPPPEEHMESRVKKYSYYYLGRKLWYIPLYFTLYFAFYVAALIIRSIGRHKVQWPNHVQKRSINDNISHKETVRKVEKLTNFVMNSIEDFKEKYL